MRNLGSEFDPRVRIVTSALPAPLPAEPVPHHLLALLFGSGLASIVLLTASLALLIC